MAASVVISKSKRATNLPTIVILGADIFGTSSSSEQNKTFILIKGEVFKPQTSAHKILMVHQLIIFDLLSCYKNHDLKTSIFFATYVRNHSGHTGWHGLCNPELLPVLNSLNCWVFLNI